MTDPVWRTRNVVNIDGLTTSTDSGSPQLKSERVKERALLAWNQGKNSRNEEPKQPRFGEQIDGDRVKRSKTRFLRPRSRPIYQLYSHSFHLYSLAPILLLPFLLPTEASKSVGYSTSHPISDRLGSQSKEVNLSMTATAKSGNANVDPEFRAHGFLLSLHLFLFPGFPPRFDIVGP